MVHLLFILGGLAEARHTERMTTKAHNLYLFDMKSESFNMQSDEDRARLLDFVDGVLITEAGEGGDLRQAYSALYMLGSRKKHGGPIGIDMERVYSEKTNNLTNPQHASWLSIARTYLETLGYALKQKEGEEFLRLAKADRDYGSQISAIDLKKRAGVAAAMWLDARETSIGGYMDDYAARQSARQSFNDLFIPKSSF